MSTPATPRPQECVWAHPDDQPAKTPFGDGIEIRTLWRGESGRRAQLVDIAAGAVWPVLDVELLIRRVREGTESEAIARVVAGGACVR